ncbi:MAG: hypothetical protein IPM59_12020 [Chloracidobacterium sp.]|nr:hypothetical protein [Chloracidobacterium sp.]
MLLLILGGMSVVSAQHDHHVVGLSAKSTTGVLLLAHGGKQNWNDEVKKIGAAVDGEYPVEIAFGMASKRNIQTAVDKLAARGVKEIVAVPLFVSSHSSVITSTEHLLGLRKEAPAALAVFAKMGHDHGSHDAHAAQATADKSFDPTTPVKSTVPIRMVAALDRHHLVAEILTSRAESISSKPKKEVVVIVAHGPVSDAENAEWLADMASLAGQMKPKKKFKRIEYLTVRDDAPEPIRSNAAAELRAVVERATKEGNRVLIVPLLLSYGGIEAGVKTRLEGLEYAMPTQGLLPDERLSRWVIESVKSR